MELGIDEAIDWLVKAEAHQGIDVVRSSGGHHVRRHITTSDGGINGVVQNEGVEDESKQSKVPQCTTEIKESVGTVFQLLPTTFLFILILVV